MNTAIEKYFTPRSMEEALSLLSTYKNEARVISGGTDLVRLVKSGKATPRCVVDISGIDGQEYITYDKKSGLKLGAQTTMESIASSPQILREFGLLASAASMLGTPQVRGRATIAGNLCNASPSAEIVPVLIVLGADIRIVHTGGERVVPVGKFCIGPGMTALNSGEIVTEILIPPLAARSGGVYLSHRVREVLDLPIVSTAVLVCMDGNSIKSAKIALGAVAPTAMRARSSESILEGKKPDDSLIKEAAQAAARESKPIDDVRSSAQYRRKIVSVLVARAVKQAIALAKIA